MLILSPQTSSGFFLSNTKLSSYLTHHQPQSSVNVGSSQNNYNVNKNVMNKKRAVANIASSSN